MERKVKWMVAGAVVASVTVGAASAVAAASRSDDGEQAPITAGDLDRASRAALDRTGSGRVTETEVGDEDSYYEVEVTFDDGHQADVQLDEQFNVVEVMDDHEDGSGR